MNTNIVSNIQNITQLQNFDDNWNLTKYVASVIDEPIGREIIIHILDIWSFVNESAKPIWLDLVERAGFYPYYIKKTTDEFQDLKSLQSGIRAAYYKSEYLPDIYFHEQQKEVERAISRQENVAVSAPTSFGKSLLIEEVVARNKYDNILVIQPTLALIDETRRKMRKYTDSYNLIVNTRQKIKERNVFILTAERVLEIKNLPKIDFFVIDEFYKISNRKNDSRIDALNVALLRIMAMKPQAMFLTPTVDSLSKSFIEKYKINFFKTDYALVNTNVIELRNKNGNPYSGDRKKKILFELLNNQTEPSIVYVKSPNEAYKLANEYVKWLNVDQNNTPTLDIFEWIDENISSEWQLKKLLENGVGVHNGALPRHIVTTEIELFNTRKINILFATVSLIEGVNTVAKNMFIFSPNKGKSAIDFFDFANIRGRAGRMGQYFTGNVYVFNEELKPENFVIDVPGVDQVEVSDEILINIPDEDLVDKERVIELKENLETDIQEIIKENMISINGQKRLYEFMDKNYLALDYLRWHQMPTYEQLWQTMYLGYKYLSGNDSQSFARKKAVTALRLNTHSLKNVIRGERDYLSDLGKSDSLNKAIHNILKFQRDDANFKIPKLLAVVESLQKYVFQKHNVEDYGEYTYFSSLLENDRVPDRLQFLLDYGVPSSAIRKIDLFIPMSIEFDQDVIVFLRENKTYVNSRLLKYESNLVNRAIR